MKARLTIQCIHPETRKVGNWLFSGDNHRTKGTSLSPVFRDMVETNEWLVMNGWTLKTHSGVYAEKDETE